jgi:hypothetical protein
MKFFFSIIFAAGIIDFSRSTNNSTSTMWIGTKGHVISETSTSHSWWILFAIRQLLVYSLARCSEVLVIDLFCLRLRWINVFHSPLLTLLFVQSRGWPFRFTTWAVYDFALLHGESAFSRHWLFYQDLLKIFNTSNPRYVYYIRIRVLHGTLLFVARRVPDDTINSIDWTAGCWKSSNNNNANSR